MILDISVSNPRTDENILLCEIRIQGYCTVSFDQWDMLPHLLSLPALLGQAQRRFDTIQTHMHTDASFSFRFSFSLWALFVCIASGMSQRCRIFADSSSARTFSSFFSSLDCQWTLAYTNREEVRLIGIETHKTSGYIEEALMAGL